MKYGAVNQGITGMVSTKFLESLFEASHEKGMDKEQLLNEASSSPISFDTNLDCISGSDYVYLLKLATEKLPDPDFGLHVGEAIKPRHYGVLGYACMSSKGVEDLIRRVDRYQCLVSNICSVSTTKNNDGIVQVFSFGTCPLPPRQLAEENIAGALTFAKWISGCNTPPLYIHFQHPEPKNTGEHQRIFNCPIFFNQDRTEIQLPKEYILEDLPQADPSFAKKMDRYAEEQILKLPQSDSIIDQASVKLADLLQSGIPSIEKLADAMDINIRTLQRQLKAEGLGYKALLETTRGQLASIYMQQESLSLTDIAFLLGFSEQSSFQRAFKRWTGDTPGKYRKSLCNDTV